MKYPPFCDIIVVDFNGLEEHKITKIANDTYNYLTQNLEREEFKVFKPMPSPISKIKNRLRYRIIIKGIMKQRANNVLNDLLKNIYSKNIKDIRVSVDVNPNNMY